MTTVQDAARAERNTLRDGLCQRAIDHFGRFGFDDSMLELSIATDTDVQTLTEFFGSIDGLRAACDDYLQATVRAAKTAALVAPDPAQWGEQLAGIDSYAPMMRYLLRCFELGDAASRTLLTTMTDNAQEYLEAAVRAGTVRASRDPAGRAHLLAMFGGGGFLLYARMHATPDDMAAVLRDFGREFLVPALELYTYGLMTDDSMFRALTDGADASR